MASQGTRLSENAPMRPRQEGDWLGKRSRTLSRAVMVIVGVDDGSMLRSVRMSVDFGEGCEGGTWGGGIRTPHTMRL